MSSAASSFKLKGPALDDEARGKIRVALKGHAVDLMATTDEDRIPAGTTVKVVDVRDDTAHVSSKEV